MAFGVGVIALGGVLVNGNDMKVEKAMLLGVRTDSLQLLDENSNTTVDSLQDEKLANFAEIFSTTRCRRNHLRFLSQR